MEKMKGKIIKGVVTAIITFLMLLAGYTAYNNFVVQKPLLRAINDLPSVKGAVIEKDHHHYQIKVELGKVGNLQEEFTELDRIIADNMGGRQYELTISGSGEEHLQEFVQSFQPFIYEALAKDNYIWLNEEIKQRIAASDYAPIDYRFFIDNERIYLQFDNGRAQLYEIIPRNLSGQE